MTAAGVVVFVTPVKIIPVVEVGDLEEVIARVIARLALSVPIPLARVDSRDRYERE